MKPSLYLLIGAFILFILFASGVVDKAGFIAALVLDGVGVVLNLCGK